MPPSAVAKPVDDEELKTFRGPDKVATLLLAMGKPLAARLLKHFDADELKQITRSAADLGSVSIPMLEELIEEFAGNFSTGVDLFGTASEVELLLNGVLPPEQIADIMADVLGGSNASMWERLASVPEPVFVSYLTKEHPQTMTVILSRVGPAFAAKIMGQLPREMRNEIMRRMLAMTPVKERAMRALENTIQDDLLSNVSRNARGDTNARMADIINKMKRDQMEDVLQNLAEVRPKDAEMLKGLLFTFDDIIKLPARSRMVLFDNVPTERIVLALKGTDNAFRELILSSLASRARRMVETELTSGSPASQRDVLKARRAIADVALEMSERGEIELNPPEGEEEDEIY